MSVLQNFKELSVPAACASCVFTSFVWGLVGAATGMNIAADLSLFLGFGAISLLATGFIKCRKTAPVTTETTEGA